MSTGQPHRSAVLDGHADAATMAEVQSLVERGESSRARDVFGGLVLRHQRRASRIAYHYLGDAADADEAVQDAFVKVFIHASSFDATQPFDLWFTRILINGCLDRRKTRLRRDRWLGRVLQLDDERETAGHRLRSGDPSPEDVLLRSERRAWITDALDRLPERQRTVCLLSLVGDHTPSEVSQATGMKESTVRVHLFRAVRKLRMLLADTHGGH